MSVFYLKDEDWNLFLSAGAFLTLVGSIVENYPREAGGLLVGTIGKDWIDGKYQPTITVTTVFPSITAKSKRNSWERRIENIERVEGVVRAFEMQILGEYHSHPEGSAELTEEDEDYIEDQCDDRIYREFIIDEELSHISWIEIVGRISKKDYQREKGEESFWQTTPGGCKLRGTVQIGTDYGFDITLSSWAYFKSKEEYYELPVYSEISSSYEPS
ncbi:MAG: hypothetical protein GF308_09580 [Candidatus Heimdallarchaeota archaeon]|nr:hypothetical protein [Candidatus Heimdallarchaeota archaeon]